MPRPTEWFLRRNRLLEDGDAIVESLLGEILDWTVEGYQQPLETAAPLRRLPGRKLRSVSVLSVSSQRVCFSGGTIVAADLRFLWRVVEHGDGVLTLVFSSPMLASVRWQGTGGRERASVSDFARRLSECRERRMGNPEEEATAFSLDLQERLAAGGMIDWAANPGEIVADLDDGVDADIWRRLCQAAVTAWRADQVAFLGALKAMMATHDSSDGRTSHWTSVYLAILLGAATTRRLGRPATEDDIDSLSEHAFGAVNSLCPCEHAEIDQTFRFANDLIETFTLGERWIILATACLGVLLDNPRDDLRALRASVASQVRDMVLPSPARRS